MLENLTAHSQGMEANSMFDSFRSRVAAARESNQLFFAALFPAERISSIFGEASAILDSARVCTTAVTLWTVTMPETPANQKAYPRWKIAALFSDLHHHMYTLFVH